MSQAEQEYYISRSIKLVKELDAKMRFFKLVLYRSFSNSEVSEIANLTLRHFMEIIPRLPYAGGKKNPLTHALIVSAWFVALSKALAAHERNEGEIRETVKKIAAEISRHERNARRRKAVSPSQKMLKSVSGLKPLFQYLTPGPPKPEPHEDFLITYLVTYVSGEPNHVAWPGETEPHATVPLPLSPNATGSFRHTYQISYQNGFFSELELLPSGVAVGA
ncbi:MAG: hypothetical protein H7Z75_06940 [Ferruginibacter sp.]|nr:hypothetical protein [Cytophagales bacterium]